MSNIKCQIHVLYIIILLLLHYHGPDDFKVCTLRCITSESLLKLCLIKTYILQSCMNLQLYEVPNNHKSGGKNSNNLQKLLK